MEGPHQCPCCDYFTLTERASFLLCPICGWEDDGQDLSAIDEVSGPNHITLREGRANFTRIGACDDAAVALVCPEPDRLGVRREIREG